VFFVRDHVNLPKIDIPGINLGFFAIPAQKDFQLQADYLQFLNPLLVVIFVPTFNILFKTLDPNVRIFTSTRKILAGFCLETFAVGLMATAGQLAASSGEKVSLAWYLAAFSSLTLGEILIYGTGLEMAYAYAPPRLKSFVAACFLVTSALANFLNMGLSRFYTGELHVDFATEGKLPPQMFFGLMTLLMIATTIAFFFVGRRFDRHNRAKSGV
jgi:dipeptide/tripeptide permease